jgi:hypothetical protein
MANTPNEEQVKSNKPKPRDPTPEELTDESSRETIQADIEKDDTTNTSIEQESSISIENPPKRARGRPKKSQSATPQPLNPRQRSRSAQPPSKPKSTPSTAKSGVPSRKPKLAVVPETQVNVSTVEETDEFDEIVLDQRPRQGSILPQSVIRPSFGVFLAMSKLTLADPQKRPDQGLTNSSGEEFCSIQRTCRKTI